MVECQRFDVRQSHPTCHIIVQIAIQRTVYLYQREVCDGYDTLHFGLHGPFQPMYILRVFGAVFGTECLELHQIYIFETCQFVQYPLGSFIQILVHINQTAGKFHVMKDFTFFLSRPFNQQNFQLLSVKTDHYTIYGNMIVGQRHVMFHVLHNIYV